jgi:pimeloyl-ACP methyl ester carboxylesterase
VAALLERQSVEVDGTTFDVVVRGDGPVTVVFVNGLGSPLEEWALVAPTIAERCRVLCYDRRTAPPTGPVPVHDAAQIATDLQHLLDALGITRPLVLVGHSWGGSVIRRFAVDHPEAVAGMVFVDASHENIRGMATPGRSTKLLYTVSTAILKIGVIRRRLLRTLGFAKLPAEDVARINSLAWIAEGRTSRAEYAGIGPSLQELMRIAPGLPPVPTRVLVAGGTGLAAKVGAKQMAAIRGVWAKAVADHGTATLVTVPDSGHYISLDQPDAVIEAIEDVLKQVSA